MLHDHCVQVLELRWCENPPMLLEFSHRRANFDLIALARFPQTHRSEIFQARYLDCEHNQSVMRCHETLTRVV